MKDFLFSLLPKKTLIFENPTKNEDLVSSIDIINLINETTEKESNFLKESFFLKKIEKTYFPLFEKEYGLPSFFNYNEASDIEKEQMIKAKIFLSKKGIKTNEDYKFLANLFNIRDIKIETYKQKYGEYSLPYEIGTYFFENDYSKNFLFIIYLPKELGEIDAEGKLPIDIPVTFAASKFVLLDNFKRLLRHILPITHDIEYEFTL